MAGANGLEPRPVGQAGELRSASVESLRALAALGVLVGHVFATSHVYADAHGTDERLIAGGSFAVYLFFALSGYLLYLPFAKRAFGSGGPIDLRRYAVNRALRILPLYYMALAVYLVARADGGTLEQWARFALFAENFSTTTVLTVNPVLWSLVIELHFYVLLPLLALVVARLASGSLTRAAVLVLVCAVASLTLRWLTLYDDPSPSPLWRYSLPSCYMFFAVGMLLALLRLGWERGAPRWLAGPLVVPELWAGAAVLLWQRAALGGNQGYLLAPASFLLVGAFVLPLRPTPITRALEWRPLAVVGVASYSLYMWHVLVIDELADRTGLDGFVPLLAVAFPLCVAVALLSYAVVERFFLRLRRRWGPTAALGPTGA